MTLSAYHQKYLDRTPKDIGERIRAKEFEFRQVIERVKFSVSSTPVKIAVLGCGVRYFVPAHKQIFEKVLGAPVRVTTFDIAIDHLKGEEGVVQHDCTQPFPGAPYDITYSSILLKFIEIEKQWNVLENSFMALRKGGIAVHFVGNEEGQIVDEKLGYYRVPFERWREELKKHNIEFTEFAVKTGPNLNMEELVWVLFNRE